MKATPSYEMSFHVPLIEGVGGGGGKNQIQALDFQVWGNTTPFPRAIPGYSPASGGHWNILSKLCSLIISKWLVL